MFQREVDLIAGTMVFFSAFVIFDLLAGELVGPEMRRRLRLLAFILLMLLTLAYPVSVINGVIVDARGAVVAAGVVLLGVPAGVVIATVGMLARLAIGGDGAWAGVAGLAMDLVFVIVAVTLTRRARLNRHLVLLSAGVAAGIGEALSLLLIPGTGREFFRTDGIPLFTAQVIGTMLIGVLAWASDDRRNEADARHSLADELIEKEQRYRLLAENSADVIALVDVRTKCFTYVSPSVLQQTGYTVEETMARPFNEALGPPDRDLAPSVLDSRIAAFEAGDESQRFYITELMLAHREHTVIDGEMVSTLLTDDAGRVTHLLSVTRDITARRDAERLRQRSDSRFRALFEQMTFGVLVQRSTGEILMVNRAAQEMLGMDAEQLSVALSNPDTIEMFTADGRAFHVSDRPGRIALRTGRPATDVILGINVPGRDETTWMSTTSIPMHIGPGDHTVDLAAEGADLGDVEIVTIFTDITAQRAAAADLRIKEAAMDAAAVGFSIVDLDNRLVYANDALLAMWGFDSLEDAQQISALDFWVDANELLAARATVGLDGTWSGVFLARRRDGSVFHAQASSSPVRDATGRIIRKMMAVQDVSERTRLQEELLVERDRLTTASKAGRVTMWDWDIDHNTMSVTGYVDPGLTFVSGDGQVPVETFLDAVHPEDRPVLFRLLTEHLSGGESYVQEYRIARDDGSWIWWRVIGASVEEDGQIVRLTGACRDITEEKVANLALEASSARLERAQHLAKIGSWEMSFLTGRLEWSPETYLIHGLVPGSRALTHATFMEFVHPADREIVENALATGLANGTPFDIEHRIVLRDGTMKWVRKNGVTEFEPNGAPIRTHGTVQDITEHRRALDAERLQEEKELAEEAVREKSAFLASMSHEIRTPMTAVLGFTQVMREDTTLSEQNHEYLEHIARSGEHLLQLIDDVLQMSKLEAGHLTLNPVGTDLDQLLTDLRALFEMRIADKGLTFELTRDTDVPRYVIADTLRLRQILINLIGNSTKFTSTGTISVHISCDTAARRDALEPGDVAVTISVSDTGAGIAPDEIGRVFERFEQTQAGRDLRAGTGLGLAISQGLARLMGGDITVVSTVGLGTTFTVSVIAPICTTCGQAEVEARKVSHEDIVGGGRRILVVDDAPENRMVLSVMLTSAGFDVEAASDGVEAVEMFTSWNPELVIMDLQMPRMDGIDAMRAIRALPGGTAVSIVAATANVFDDDRARVLAAGGNGFIPKPFTKAQLLDTVGEMLGLSPSTTSP